MTENFKMIAKTFFGFEPLLESELRNLGAQDIVVGTRAVSFVGDKGFMYKANLALRTALKVLKPIHTFRATNERSFYDGIYAIHWETYLNVASSFVIDATVHSETFRHSEFIAQKAKDAIVDQFRASYDARPSVEKRFPDLRINVHIDRDQVTVSLDSSGVSLHQRGYRTATNIAPINEVLAAGLLLHAGWKGQSDFLDPMCGSGTILIEAAMIACNIPANLNRKEFAFEKWKDWDNELFDTIVEALLKKTTDFKFAIVGFDKAPSAVEKATENVKQANLEDYISVKRINFFETEKGTEESLFMLFNPPYGERLDIDLERFYRELGDTMKQHYSNTSAWLITANLDALKFIGLKPSRKIKVFNANLESRLVNYQMYSGSKRAKFNPEWNEKIN